MIEYQESTVSLYINHSEIICHQYVFFCVSSDYHLEKMSFYLFFGGPLCDQNVKKSEEKKFYKKSEDTHVHTRTHARAHTHTHTHTHAILCRDVTSDTPSLAVVREKAGSVEIFLALLLAAQFPTSL